MQGLRAARAPQARAHDVYRVSKPSSLPPTVSRSVSVSGGLDGRVRRAHQAVQVDVAVEAPATMTWRTACSDFHGRNSGQTCATRRQVEVREHQEAAFNEAQADGDRSGSDVHRNDGLIHTSSQRDGGASNTIRTHGWALAAPALAAQMQELLPEAWRCRIYAGPPLLTPCGYR